MTNKMNFDKLTNELCDLYQSLKDGKTEPALAHELNVTALSIQGMIRLGLLNAKLRNETPELTIFKKPTQE